MKVEPHSFDRAAPGYDAQFSHRRLGRWLRSRVHRHLQASFPFGTRVLEMGCGTGEDAVMLAERGVHVLATDTSPAMLGSTREKACSRGVSERIFVVPFDLEQPGSLRQILTEAGVGAQLDGAFSNFGAWNCVADRRTLGAALAHCLRPGTPLVLVVMGPFCLSESLLALASGRLAAARRRRSGVQARIGENDSLPVYYPSPRRLGRELAPWFRPRRLEGVGVLLPPSDMAGLVDRWPRLFGAIEPLDRALGRLALSSWLADHYLAVFERLPARESDAS